MKTLLSLSLITALLMSPLISLANQDWHSFPAASDNYSLMVDEIDLELTMAASEPEPEAYAVVNVNITVENNSDETATDVAVSFDTPEGLVLVGANPYQASQGTVNTYAGIWTIGQINANSSVNLTLNFFTLDENEKTVFAQVRSANEIDIDSNSDNAIAPNVNEDDEDKVIFHESGTVLDPNLVVGGFSSISVINPQPGSGIGFEVYIANIGGPVSVDDFPFTSKLYLSEDQNPSSDDVELETLLASGFDFFIMGGIIPENFLPGTYYAYVIVDVENDIAESEEDDNVSSYSVIEILDEQGLGIDLEMSMTQSVEAPAQWSNYTVTATINNTGSEIATGIEVEFKKPEGVVYVGGNEFELSQGSFNLYTNENWHVGTLAPGASANITVRYFLKLDNAPIAYAQVAAANELDLDSTPGNGIAPIVNEDDEASTSGGAPEKPDLIIADLRITSYLFLENEFDFNYTVSNIGDAATAASGIVATPYLSEDMILDSSDYGFGNGGGFFISNLSAGQSDQKSAGYIYPSSFSGRYYFILQIDGEEVVDESNEGNNIFVFPIDIPSNDEEGLCKLTLTNGFYDCVESDTDGSAKIKFQNGDIQYSATVNTDGELEGIFSTSRADQFRLKIQEDKVSKENISQNNSLVFEKTIPADLFASYDYFTSAAEFNDGFILFAYKNLSASTSIFDALWAIKTDADLNPILVNEIYTGGPAGAVNTYGGLQINDQQMAFVISEGLLGNRTSRLAVIDENLTILSNEVYAYGYVSSLNIYALPCGNFRVSGTSSTGFCPHGSCSTTSNTEGVFQNGEFVKVRRTNTYANLNFGSGVVSAAWSLTLTDGAIFNASKSLILPGDDINADFPLHFTKRVDGEIVEDFELTPMGKPLQLIEINELIYLLVDNDGLLQLVKLDCLDPNEEDKADITVSNFNILSTIVKSETTPFTFDLSNIGTAVALEDYDINVFISATPNLQIGAASVGNVPTGNTPIGTISDVLGAVNIDQAYVFSGGQIYPVDFAPGDYYLFLVADSGNDIDELDEDNNMAMMPITLIDIGLPVPDADVELTVELSTTVPSLYSNYMATYTITNKGFEAASNIEVAIPRPENVVYVGGNAYSTTAGTFNTYTDRYRLENLGGGASQTLMLHYFLRGTASQQHYAQVIAMDQVDFDSTPGNGSCCTVQEDDETFIATEEVQNRRSAFELYEDDQVEILHIYPNPSYDPYVNLTIGSPENMEQVMIVYDALGNEVQRSTIYLEKGIETIQLPTDQLTSGQYRIIVVGENMRFMENMFLITR